MLTLPTFIYYPSLRRQVRAHFFVVRYPTHSCQHGPAGYCAHVFEQLEVLAEDLSSESFEALGDVAKERGSYICFGVPGRHAEGYTIRQVVLDDTGSCVAVYDKCLGPWMMTSSHLTPSFFVVVIMLFHCFFFFLFPPPSLSLNCCRGFIYVTLVTGVKRNGSVQETGYATLIVEDFAWGC